MKKTNTDAPFFLLMGKIGDLVFANVLWLVCCIPVVTAGASTLGLFTVVNKLAAREDYTVRTDFFKAFKRDFKQSTALWLVVLLGGLAGFRGLQIATAQDTASNGVLPAFAGGGLLRQLGLCPAGPVQLSESTQRPGRRRAHDAGKSLAQCGHPRLSGVAAAAGKGRPGVVRVSGPARAAHRRFRFGAGHGGPDAPRLRQAGKAGRKEEETDPEEF